MSLKGRKGKTSQNSEKEINLTDIPTENAEFRELSYARKVLVERLSRFEQYLLDNTDAKEIFACEIRLKNVEDDLREFDKVQTRLEFMDPNERQNRLETESIYYNVISEAKKFIKLAHASQNCGTAFKSIFESLVHDRTDLSETEKLLYLKLCCKGDALKIIDSFEITPGNYTVALNLSKKRYENKKAVVNYHVRNILFNLPSAIKDSATNVRKLIDTVQQHKAALEKLKLPVDKWDALLNPIILSKLDERTNHEWERKQCHTESPTVNQLLDFLTDKCFALESSRGFSRPQPHRPDKDRNENRGQERGNGSASSKNYSYSLMQRVGRECHICNENHFVYQCPRFTQLSVSEKYNEIRKHKLCSNCLRIGHLNQECKSSGCKKCAKKHNTALHYEKREVGEGVQYPKNDGNSAPPLLPIDKQTMNKGKYSESEQSTRLPNSQDQDDARHRVDYSLTLASASLERDQVLLSTANILIADEKGEWQKCNALLDSGSQSNLMSERLCRKLNLSFKRINMPLYGISQLVTEINRQTQVKIKSRFNSFEANLTFLVLPTLTENLPLFKFSRAALKIPSQINLADEHFNEPKNIDILLGVDIFYDLLGSGKIKLGEKLPVLQETSLGWVISGNLAEFGSRNQKTVCNLSTNISNKMLNDSLTKFWHVEEFEHSKFLSKEESYCEEYFTQTTTRDKDNSFIVKYPFKIEKNLKLGESKPIALSRLKNLERKLEKNEELNRQYVDFMNEYETLGHMTRQEPIGNDDSMPNSSYFLPHRAVVKDSITTKCRVVFDASCKTSSGVSLNDTLMVGPVVQEELYAILLRLRLRKIVLSADIKMMYRYIKIQDSERDYQKILWQANSRDPVSVYRLNTVTYGTSNAPFQATRCLVELARQNENTYPRTSEIIKRSFYMDDFLVSLNSEEEALNVYKELNNNRSSSLLKLRRVMGYICRFKEQILKRTRNESISLTVDELNEAQIILVKLAQGETFHKEIDELSKNNKLVSDSQILNLNPFLDSAGILRVGGQLTNSDLSYEQRHPIILACKHRFTDLVIMDGHMKHLHAGVQNLLSIIRLQFWIVNGKNAIKHNLSRCVRCFKAKPKPLKFLMGSLPAARVKPSRPFSNCGVDYAGPILVKEGTLRRTKRVKTYICIFVCFATRAVHIDLVKDLSTASFLNALDRFCSRRGKPTDIHSDNGSNFVGANNHFLELSALINSQSHINAVTSHLANNRIKWHFLPARSAHMGGLWEAAVKSIKFHLRRVLGESCLAYEEMHTLLTKIEACLNSRPLMPISNDANDYLPLTPAHFLIGDPLVNLPQLEIRDVTISRLSRYERLLQLQQQFWNRWSRDYLTNLQTRSRWKKPKDKSIAIGSLVLLAEVPPNEYNGWAPIKAQRSCL
ncbi:uncharacterized protein [Euwallacea similis]|uniref:uncharacterized protein n=1 Tax=Euwallacea similis TaxID=1736056 RepID=UPI00344EE81B